MAEPKAREAAALISAVADPVRWTLLAHLVDRGAPCVCRLQEVAGVAPNLLGYHRRVPREAGLVTARRRGRWVDYSVSRDAAHVLAALPTPATVVP